MYVLYIQNFKIYMVTKYINIWGKKFETHEYIPVLGLPEKRLVYDVYDVM